VILDKDLAILYGAETKALNQAVKRNIERFPDEFMFRLNKQENDEILRSQFVTLEMGRYSKYLPYAFTEYGVAMLSSVLNSKKAIQVNIQIIKTFVRLREIIISNKELRQKIEELEKKNEKRFKVIFDVIRRLLDAGKKEPLKEIGFRDRKKKK